MIINSNALIGIVILLTIGYISDYFNLTNKNIDDKKCEHVKHHVVKNKVVKNETI
jgi:hypothetical protein